MERAAPAPCSAPMINAILAHTHTRTYACDHISADENACINTQGLAGAKELNA